MNTLQTTQTMNLLDDLFAEAQRSERTMRMPRDLNPLSKTTYREFYAGMKDVALPVSRETGLLLYSLVRSTGAKAVLEFGTSFGISAIYIAAALRDNGGGRLITTEFEAGKITRARQNLTSAGLIDLVEIRDADAMQTLTHDLPKLDLVLLDGAKGLYLDALKVIKHRLRPGALILADDTNYCPEYVQAVRRATKDFISLPVARYVELSVKLQ